MYMSLHLKKQKQKQAKKRWCTIKHMKSREGKVFGQLADKQALAKIWCRTKCHVLLRLQFCWECGSTTQRASLVDAVFIFGLRWRTVPIIGPLLFQVRGQLAHCSLQEMRHPIYKISWWLLLLSHWEKEKLQCCCSIINWSNRIP